jgi:hypothetical protein
LPEAQPTPSVQRPAPPSPSRTSGDTVVVACKLPAGVILRVFRMEDRETILAAGSRVVEKIAVPFGQTVTIRGNAVDPAQLMQGVFPEHVFGQTGYALTHDVPREIWDLWYEQNKESDLVRNGLIFAHATERSARDQARDGAKLLSGLEPIDPKDPGAKTAMRGAIQPGDRKD